MDTDALVARLGVLACLVVLLLVAVPYGVVGPEVVAVYYDAGLLGPPYFALAAVVAALALQSGAVGRSDPATVAGVAVVFSGVLALLALVWAFAVAPETVGGISAPSWFGYHRWAVAIVALVAPVMAGLYARAVL